MSPRGLDSRVRRPRILVAVIPFVIRLVRLLNLALPSRCSLILENLAFLQQLAVYKRNTKRPRLREADRLFWASGQSLFAQLRLFITNNAIIAAWLRLG